MAKRNVAPRLAHLGRQSRQPTRELEPILWRGGQIVVELVCSEFTSHCPVTDQPDFGHLVIRYEPRRSIVETKSLKLFLWSYRHARAFNEAIVAEIAETFLKQIKPEWVEVEARFASRGGISVQATAYRRSK